MIRVIEVLPHAHVPVDTITLDEGDRHRRRIAMRSDGGVAFLLDLPAARLLRHGEGLRLEDGRVIEVRAVPERLLEVRGRDARHLLALTWQIGNRHLKAQVGAERLLVRDDPVIAEMLEGLGATLRVVEEPFDPEGGAYGATAHAPDHGPIHHHHD